MKKNKIFFWGLVAVVVFFIGCAPKQSKAVSETKNASALNNLVVPLKDLQVFEDADYTEVVNISRDAWDKERLPSRVLELEGKGYACAPLPLEFEEAREAPGMFFQRAVKKVQWNCELPE